MKLNMLCKTIADDKYTIIVNGYPDGFQKIHVITNDSFYNYMNSRDIAAVKSYKVIDKDILNRKVESVSVANGILTINV